MKRLFALVPVIALAGCLPHPDPPPPPYRAAGTEPFWGLLIDPINVTFTAPDMTPITQPTPAPINGFAGPIYQTPLISVNIVKGVQCNDGMSDRVYPDKVQVTVDGKRYEGCGGL